MVIIPSVVLEKVYDDDDGRQMIAIAHWDLRPRRAKTKLIVKIYMKKVEIYILLNLQSLERPFGAYL